ncbi:MAG: oligosaccharide flippase family protein [Bacilli bacterium]|nr:oligosaccharide flippase family protein [Bacilli bacterium]
MKKNKFVVSTLILIVGGFITKILGMIIKIIMTRLVGTEGIGLYMLINPTFVLFIAICTLGLPTAISKLVSEEKRNNKKLVFSAISISIIINLILMFTIIFGAKFISNTLLHDERTYYSILAIGLVLPFISISSILRGYFFGKQKTLPHVISNITEDVTRLISIILFVPFFLSKGLEFAVMFLVLSNIISELTSILILFFFLPKNFKLNKNDITPSLNNIKDILEISLPSTGSRLIGCIGMFFEPIILTYFLGNTIVSEYGVLNGYIMPLILLPSFFTSAISQALLPIVSNAYSNNKKNYVLKKIKQAIFYSLLIGIPATLIFVLIPEIPLNLIYNTNEGISFIKFLAPICLLHYIQSPLTSSLQAIGDAKSAMNGTLIGMILRTTSLILFCILDFGIWSLIFASSINIIFVTIHHIIYIKKILK